MGLQRSPAGAVTQIARCQLLQRVTCQNPVLDHIAAANCRLDLCRSLMTDKQCTRGDAGQGNTCFRPPMMGERDRANRCQKGASGHFSGWGVSGVSG